MRCILFEDAGKTSVGKVLSASATSHQVELESGKRVKVKTTQVFLVFDTTSAGAWLQEAQTLADSMDTALAWEFAPEGEFDAAQLATDYFSARPSTQEQAAALLCLRATPHYFRRAGKGGRFKKVDAETVAQALRALEKKKQIQEQINQWVKALRANTCPEAIRSQIYKILFKPDKNGAEYKAVIQAAQAEKISVLALLQNANAIDSAYALHWQRFLWESFPQGLDFPTLPDWQAQDSTDLPVAQVRAFSIDDMSTTEIDDALSVQGLGSGHVRVGIHIACPAFGINPEDTIDTLASERLSTVYMPGTKITMLPPAVVEAYTLRAGQERVVLSLYTDWDEQQCTRTGHETVLERIAIADNLRLEHLEPQIECDAKGNLQTNASLPYASELQFLHRLAHALKNVREAVRGKPETHNRPDYSFEVLKPEPQALPQGSESVRIHARQRGTVLDLIVAESMILANSTWGAWLGQLGVPAIYRSQASLSPGVKVRMGTKPLPHAGIGVAYYAWSTSPLRRYIDLLNQWQLLAAFRHGNTAALAAPFSTENNSALLGIVSAFDTAYTSYKTFQSQMERYWVLQYLLQNNIEQIEASVIRAGLARANTLPLLLSIAQTQNMERGTQVRLAIRKIDTIALELDAVLLEVLEQATSLTGEDEEFALAQTSLAGLTQIPEGEAEAADTASAASAHEPAPEDSCN